MKNYLSIGLLLGATVFYTINAQEVTKTDTLSGTPLITTMDARVMNALENMEDNCNKKSTYSSATSTPSSSNNSTKTAPVRVLAANRALTTAEICRQNPRIMGIKIQLAVVKSNDEANEVKAYFRRRFPMIKVETDASLRPNYKILAGSYFNKHSASGDLSKIRQFFKSAVPVQYRVFCAESK